ncbi:uncharacterized protein TA16095 [Theileria annulata]|uniref:Uncharacterized protein n=1 Tax=Theileria annulata TaxID=5874 RepID=Q4UIG1_THEAN|nr:uncharacterized protein TA16095 [Theileria annulata]CAI73128.1 hypothetical protein, conserved [Theileria annulata]|eukprot:XP_953806.1 hypothetical protein, conserved [Theileria annulata]
MAMNKCIKLFLILVFVVAVAFGVTFLPFNLSDKFKAVVDKVSSHLRGLGGMGSDEKVRLDFSKRDSYTHGNLNVVLDKADNVPKDGYLKFIHKGEKDLPLDVEGFTLGDTTLDGVEPGLLDYAAGYFKGESPHLLLVELCLHNKGDGDNGNGEGNKDETNKGETDPNGTEGGKGTGPGDKTEGEKVFYCPGENNKWVKLPDGADLGAKVDEVFATLSANTPPTGTPEGGVVTTPVLPATPLPGNQNLDFPKGESPVPAPQNYPLTGPGAPTAAVPLPVGGATTGSQQPGNGAPAGGQLGPVVPGTPDTVGTAGTGGHGTTPQGPVGTPAGGQSGNDGAPGTAGTGVPGGAGVSEPGRNGLTGETGAQGGVSSVGQGTHSVPSGLVAGVGGAGGVGVEAGAGAVGQGTDSTGEGRGAGGVGVGVGGVAGTGPAPAEPAVPTPKVPEGTQNSETTTGGVQQTASGPAGPNGGTTNQNNGGGVNGQGGSNGGGSSSSSVSTPGNH